MNEIKHTINASIQIVPHSKSADHYEIIDEAIKLIQKSGLKYKVTPMETVIEGNYDAIMELFKAVQLKSLNVGADELMVSIRLHIKKDSDVSFESKIGKYSQV